MGASVLGHGLDNRLRFELAAPAGAAGEFGRAVAGLGDLDGDGTPDLAVGSPEGFSGAVHVLSGADASTLYVVDGPNDFGIALAGLGDATGDGVPDLVVGVPSLSAIASKAGAAYLISGATGDYAGAVIGTFSGHELGASLVGLPDLDDDGRADFAVGSPGGSRVSMVSGATGDVLWTSVGGPGPGGFGASLARIADSDADGVPELLVGEPGDGDGSTVSRAHLLSGADGATLLTLEGDGGFGTAVAAAGDVDGDGRPDLAVGAPLADGEAGRVVVLSGGDGRQLAEFACAAPGARFGAALAGGDDLDGDRVVDLAIGAPLQQDAVGFPYGAVHVVDVAAGTPIASFSGSLEDGGFGASVAIAGDLDGDGIADLVAGGGPGLDASVPKPVSVYHDLDHRGPPTLLVTGETLPGQPFTLAIASVAPHRSVALVVGASLVMLPFKGGVLVPDPLLIVLLATDAQGDITLATTWPGGLPLWATFYLQAWEQDDAGPQGFLASDAVAVVQVGP